MRTVVLLVAAILFAAVALFAYAEYKIHSPQNGAASPLDFPVRAGDTYTSVARRLEHRGILHDSLLFALDARLQGLGTKLQVGTYILRPSMSIDQIVSTLAGNKVRLLTITIPPGWRADQIAEHLHRYGISGSQFLKTVRHPHFGLAFSGRPTHMSLEGVLFPDTYSVAPGTSGEAFARMMVRQFGHAFGPKLRARARHERRSIYRVTKMASIIEREAAFPTDRPRVASVYYNRLHAGMLLQSDPTVQYALGTPKDWWPPITVAPSSVNSPYNTYRHYGLPPEPIANPSRESLLAALYPAHTRYFYFFGKKSGHLVFEQTLQEHNADVLKYG